MKSDGVACIHCWCRLRLLDGGEAGSLTLTGGGVGCVSWSGCLLQNKTCVMTADGEMKAQFIHGEIERWISAG